MSILGRFVSLALFISVAPLLLGQSVRIVPQVGHRDGVLAGHFTADGEEAITAGGDGRVCLWDVRTGTQIATLGPHAGQVDYLAITPDKRWAVCAARDEVVVWDVQRERALVRRTVPFPVEVTISPSGKSVLYDGTLYALPSFRPIRKIPECIQAAFLPGGRFLARDYSGYGIYRADNGAKLARGRFPIEGSCWTTPPISPDGKLTAFRTSEGVLVASLTSVKKVVGFRVSFRDSPNDHLAFSPDGKWLAINGDQNIALYDWRRGIQAWKVSAPWETPQSLSFSRDGKHLLVGRESQLLWVKASSGVTERTIGNKTEVGLRGAELSPDGSRLLRASGDSSAGVYDSKSGRRSWGFGGLTEELESLDWSSPSGAAILSEGALRFLNFETSSFRKAVPGIRHASVLGSDRRGGVLIGGGRGMIGSISGRAISTPPLRLHGGAVKRVRASKNGAVVVSVATDGKVVVRSLANPVTKEALDVRWGAVAGISLSRDGRWAALRRQWYDPGIEFFDLQAQKTVRKLDGPDLSKVEQATLSPDGRRLLVRGWGVCLYDVESGKQVSELLAMSGNTMGGRFSPDGSRVVIFSPEGVAAFRADDGKLVWKNRFVATGLAIDQAHDCAVAVSEYSGLVARFNLTDGSAIGEPRRFEFRLSNSVFGRREGQEMLSPDGQFVIQQASDFVDDRKVIQSTATGETKIDLKGETSSKADALVYSGFMKDGSVLALRANGQLERYETEKGTKSILGRIPQSIADRFEAGQNTSPSSLELTTLGDRLFVVGVTGPVQEWSLAPLKFIRTLSIEAGWTRDAVPSDNGSRVLVAGPGTEASLWDVASRIKIEEFRYVPAYEGGTYDVTAVDWAERRGRVAVGDRNGSVRLWSISGRLEKVLVGKGPEIETVRFTDDGLHLVATDETGAVRLWNLDTGRSTALRGHTAGVEAAAFDSRGRWLLTLSRGDGSVRLWNMASGQLGAAIYFFTDGSWAVVDSRGRYDASGRGAFRGLRSVRRGRPSGLRVGDFEKGLLGRIWRRG